MNLFQSPEWEQFKLKTGYEKSYRIDGILVLQKKLPLKRTMLYSPMVSEAQVKSLKVKSLKERIINIAKENKAIFYRLELDIPNSPQLLNFLTSNSFTKSFEEMQPEHTLILDISKNEEEILAQMKPKGRYNIKVAERHDLKISKEKTIDNFYHFYQEMAKRQKISYRNKEYFQKLIDILGEKDYCEVLTAFAKAPYEITNLNKSTNKQNMSTNDRRQTTDDRRLTTDDRRQTTDDLPIASIIVSYYGNRATYLFGGSSHEYRNQMAPYLLQWQAIKEAKQRGLKEYDFFGIAPNDDPNQPWAGVTRFKKQFGGEEVNLLGSWDLIFEPTQYKLFKIAEKIRRQ